MAKYGKCNFDGLKDLQKKIEKFQKDEMDAFIESCARELAARLLAKVIKRTPVGDYSGDSYTCISGKTHKGHKVPGMTGGTLRRGWTAQASGSGSEGLKTRGARQYVDTLKVHYFGDSYVIEITNPVEYASYVEYGHRTAGHKGWVPGHFMLTISEKEIRDAAPGILAKKIQKEMEKIFK